jgi:hypothetical protein
MAGEKNKTWAREIVIGGGAAALGLVFTDVWTWTKGAVATVWQWLSSTAVVVWDHLAAHTSVPHWLLYFGGVVVLMAALLVVAAIVARKELARDGQVQPLWRSYQEDRFFGVVWRWLYAGTSIDTESVRAYCPTCDGLLVYSEGWDLGGGSVLLHCETCNTDRLEDKGTFQLLQGRVVRQVDRKIRTGEFKQAVNGANDGK